MEATLINVNTTEGMDSIMEMVEEFNNNKRVKQEVTWTVDTWAALTLEQRMETIKNTPNKENLPGYAFELDNDKNPLDSMEELEDTIIRVFNSELFEKHNVADEGEAARYNYTDKPVDFFCFLIKYKKIFREVWYDDEKNGNLKAIVKRYHKEEEVERGLGQLKQMEEEYVWNVTMKMEDRIQKLMDTPEKERENLFPLAYQYDINKTLRRADYKKDEDFKEDLFRVFSLVAQGLLFIIETNPKTKEETFTTQVGTMEDFIYSNYDEFNYLFTRQKEHNMIFCSMYSIKTGKTEEEARSYIAKILANHKARYEYQERTIKRHVEMIKEAKEEEEAETSEEEEEEQ